MPLAKQYLRYVPAGSHGIVCSRKTGTLLLEKRERGRKKLLAIAPALEDIIVWDLKTGNKVITLHGERHEVSSLCLHPSSFLLAAGYEDGTIRLWNLESHECQVTFSGHKSAVLSLGFDALGTRLVSGGKDTDVIVWDIVNECGLYRLKGHKGPVTWCRFMTNYNVLITCSKDTYIKLWDLDTCHCFQTLVDHRSEVWAGELLRNETRLVTASSDFELRIYDILPPQDNDKSKWTRSEDDIKSGSGPISCLLLGNLKRQSSNRVLCLKCDSSADNLVVMSGDSLVEVYNIRSDEELEKRRKKRVKKARKKALDKGEEWVESKVELTVEDEFSLTYCFKSSIKMKSCDLLRLPDDNLQLLLSLHTNMLELHTINLTLSTSTITHSISLPGHRSDIRTVSISSDGDLIASGSSDMIKLWNCSNFQCIHTLLSNYYVVSSTFVPGNRHLLVGTKSGEVLLYEVTSGSLLETFQAHTGSVWAVGVAPDRQGFATGSADHDVKFWEFELTTDDDNPGRKRLTAAHVKTLKMSEDVLGLKYSPNQKVLALSLLDSTVKIFFADTLKFFLSLYGHKLPVLSMDISSDNTLLVTGSADKNIRIWGLDFGDCHRSIFAHDDSIMAVQFVPDTHLFFTGSKDRTLKCWDADNFEHVQTLEGHQAEVWTLAVSSDGNTVVTGSHDLSLRLWECSQEPLVLSEERENEREAEFEKAVAEGGEPVIPGEQTGEVSMAGRKTIGTMKSAERIMEALEIWREEGVKIKEYNEECELAGKKLPLPPCHQLLKVLGNTTPEKYVLTVVKGIRSSDLEEALLVIPFSYMIDLLRVCDNWITKRWDIELTCRCVFFLIRVHHHQIITSRLLLPIIDSLRQHISTRVESLRDLYGFNLAGMQYLQREIENSSGESIFTDKSIQPKQGKKRTRL